MTVGSLVFDCLLAKKPCKDSMAGGILLFLLSDVENETYGTVKDILIKLHCSSISAMHCTR